jgi:uncharacterized membrane protein YdjX (TVP38/TMEM64 family)
VRACQGCYYRAVDLAAVIDGFRGAGVAGAAALVVAYVLAAVTFLPVWPLTLAAGMAWGTLGGAAVAWPSATLGGTVAFLLGRRFLAERVRGWIARRPMLAAVDAAVTEGGVRVLALLRLSPVVPASALHYALSASRLPARDFVVGTLAGTLPPIALQAWMGSVAGRWIAPGEPGAGPGTAGTILQGVGVAATVVAVLALARSARRALLR